MARAKGHRAAQQELETPVPGTTSGLSPPKTKEHASPKNVARKRGPKICLGPKIWWPETWSENVARKLQKRGPKTWPENFM